MFFGSSGEPAADGVVEGEGGVIFSRRSDGIGR